MRKIGWEGFWSVMGLVPVFEKFEGRQSLCPPSQSPQIPPLQGFTPPPPPFFRIVFLTAFFSSHSGFASPLLFLPILVLLHTNLEPSLTEVMPTPNTHLSNQLHRQVTKLDPRHQVRCGASRPCGELLAAHRSQAWSHRELIAPLPATDLLSTPTCATCQVATWILST